MKKTPFRIVWTLLCSALLAGSIHAADLDTVYRPGDSKGFAGQISNVSKTEVVITQRVGNKEERFPGNEVARIEFQGEPPVLNLARGNENAGRLQEALTGYQEALAAGGNETIKTEINYLIARVLSKMAQADPTKAAAAIEKLNGLTNNARDHYRFYPTQLLLGETALLIHDHNTAEAAFDRVQQAPWEEYKMRGKNGTARTLVDQQKYDQAKPLFDAIAVTKAKTPAEQTAVLEAMLGQAECLQMQTQIEPAIEILQKVVSQATAGDTRVLAQSYLQLGSAYAIDGQKNKEALLAYLHVDVIPSLAAQSDLHAEALYNLAKLWPAVGQPARGAEASGKLMQDYATSEWAKKLDAVE
ncbi:MAG TPA: hypothetical protein VNQ76_22060 [Planctomicrobium sp.]|nr:hypothetical protein [Planctomicrobium sp.]